MTWFFVRLALVLVSAGCYRIRGSDYQHLMPGNRVLKLTIGAFPVGCAVALIGVPWYLALAVIAITAALDTLPHAAFQGARNGIQVLGMSALGVASLLGAVLVTWHSVGPDEALAVISISILTGPAYYAGNKIPVTIVGIRQGPELGELLNGLVRVMFVFLV
jgi:uncharacterized membrane protein YfbV (UPF0208 family)